MGITFEQKAKIYYNGVMKSIQEGQYYLGHLETYALEKKNRLECVPDLVSVSVTQNLIKQIYNYLTIKFDESVSVAYNDILITSRVDGMLPINETKNNTIQQNKYLNQTYSLTDKSGSATHITSANSLTQKQQNVITKKPIKVEFSSSQNFLSPKGKDRLQSPNYLPPPKSPR